MVGYDIGMYLNYQQCRSRQKRNCKRTENFGGEGNTSDAGENGSRNGPTTVGYLRHNEKDISNRIKMYMYMGYYWRFL